MTQKGMDVTNQRGKAGSDPTDLGEDGWIIFCLFQPHKGGEDGAVDVILRREQRVDSHLKEPEKNTTENWREIESQ